MVLIQPILRQRTRILQSRWCWPFPAWTYIEGRYRYSWPQKIWESYPLNLSV